MATSTRSEELKTRETSLFVNKLFNNIAPIYDLLNNIMSFGLHKCWKTIAVKNLDVHSGQRVLDLCCGSGDMSAIILDRSNKDVEIVAVDFSEKMLELAQNRLKESVVNFVQADVIDLPFEDSTFDRVIISFGLRNVSELDKAVKEMYRVLKNGGIMVNIDFGKPSSILARAIFELYFSYFVPLLGKIFHKHVEYSYLIHSIHRFPAPIELIQIFKKAGFVKSTNKELFMGFVSVQTSIK